MQVPVVIIIGPTAVGKTKVAVEVAKRLNGEIISGDSVQVYRMLDIGTAKIKPEERQGVPHHLIDIVDPDENYTVADFQQQARELIIDIHRRHKLPFIVGGTGLYIRSVIDPYEFEEIPDNLALREQLKAKAATRQGQQELYQELCQVDPDSAQKIHANDLRRVIRALEVYYLTGKPISSYHKLRGSSGESPFLPVMVGLNMDRGQLYNRINQRVDMMMEEGFLAEVQSLLGAGYTPDLKSMQSLGYKQLVAYLQGELSLAQAVEEIKKETRHFAKRQLTWFRRDPRITWFDVEKYSNFYRLVDGITGYICRSLNIVIE